MELNLNNIIRDILHKKRKMLLNNLKKYFENLSKF